MKANHEKSRYIGLVLIWCEYYNVEQLVDVKKKFANLVKKWVNSNSISKYIKTNEKKTLV